MILFVSIAKFKEIERYFEKIKDTLREGCKHKILMIDAVIPDEFYLNYERLVKNFVSPIYNVNCKVGLCC